MFHARTGLHFTRQSRSSPRGRGAFKSSCMRCLVAALPRGPLPHFEPECSCAYWFFSSFMIEVEVYSFVSICWRPPSPNAVQQMGRITANWMPRGPLWIIPNFAHVKCYRIFYLRLQLRFFAFMLIQCSCDFLLRAALHACLLELRFTPPWALW